MKTSIERAKRAFDSFASTSEKTWKSLETTSQSARVGLTALNTKIAEITRNNAEANFALALKLAESSDLAAQIIQDANPARPDVPTSSARSSSAGSSSAGASPFAASSSYTPGGGSGRGN
jgi:predicted DNA-binding ribbon-helix-helix protein